jgi:hypothetical protein
MRCSHSVARGKAFVPPHLVISKELLAPGER